jgi:hypothetical protein
MRDHNDDPGAVAMPLLVGARVEDGHVASMNGRGEGNPYHASPGPALAEGVQAVPGQHVREEVADPDVAGGSPVGIAHDLSLRIEPPTVAVQVVQVHHRTIEEKRRIGDRGHGRRQAISEENAGGLATVRITELVSVVGRDQEEAVLLPLEGSRRAIAGPDRRQAAAFHHVGKVVDGEPKRGQRGPRGDLDQRCTAHPLLTG